RALRGAHHPRSRATPGALRNKLVIIRSSATSSPASRAASSIALRVGCPELGSCRSLPSGWLGLSGWDAAPRALRACFPPHDTAAGGGWGRWRWSGRTRARPFVALPVVFVRDPDYLVHDGLKLAVQVGGKLDDGFGDVDPEGGIQAGSEVHRHPGELAVLID